MAECGQSERASFGKIARSQTKYGTNSKASTTNEAYLKHHIKTGDTLQGIALKYACTMEQLKRVNNIWTNDSLFRWEYVLVPLSRSPLQEAPSLLSNGESSDGARDFEIITKQDLQNAGRMSRSVSANAVTGGRLEAPGNSEPSPKDYFSKFDSALAQIRTSVQQLDKASNFLAEDEDPLSLLPSSRRASRYGSRHKSRSFDVTFGGDDVSVEPGLVFKSHARGTRTLRGSIERLEKTADEIFQL